MVLHWFYTVTYTEACDLLSPCRCIILHMCLIDVAWFAKCFRSICVPGKTLFSKTKHKAWARTHESLSLSHKCPLQKKMSHCFPSKESSGRCAKKKYKVNRRLHIFGICLRWVGKWFGMWWVCFGTLKTVCYMMRKMLGKCWECWICVWCCEFGRRKIYIRTCVEKHTESLYLRASVRIHIYICICVHIYIYIYITYIYVCVYSALPVQNLMKPMSQHKNYWEKNILSVRAEMPKWARNELF